MAISPPPTGRTAEEVMKDDGSQYMTICDHRDPGAGHRHRPVGAGVPDRRALDGVLLFAAHGPHRPAGACPPEMWFVMREDEPEARAMLPTTIPWKLLQGIALVQLYLEERLGRAAPRWTGCPTASCTTRPCPPWPPAARCPHGALAGPGATVCHYFHRDLSGGL